MIWIKLLLTSISHYSIYFSVETIYFTKELEDTKIKDIGKPATLLCEISKDGLKIDWFHGKTKIRRGEDYDIVADGKTHKLVIEEVTEDLVGEFRAEYKTASTTCQLYLAGIIIDLSFCYYRNGECFE